MKEKEHRPGSVTIILDGDRPISWNQMYSGLHWSSRKELADTTHKLVWWTVKEQLPGASIFKNKVAITVRAYMNGRILDCDNVATKLYIDGLKGILIEDDDLGYVGRVTAEVIRVKEDPRVEIEVTEMI